MSRRRDDDSEAVAGGMILLAFVVLVVAGMCGGYESPTSRDQRDQRECRTGGGSVEFFDDKHPDNWRCTRPERAP